jgi:hypothetical protein
LPWSTCAMIAMFLIFSFLIFFFTGYTSVLIKDQPAKISIEFYFTTF